jgi:uncharacterized protein with PIN domain
MEMQDVAARLLEIIRRMEGLQEVAAYMSLEEIQRWSKEQERIIYTDARALYEQIWRENTGIPMGDR